MFYSRAAPCCCSGAAGFEIGALDADVGSRAQQLQALLARVQNTAVHIKDLSLNTQRRPAPRSASRCRARGSALCVAAAVRRERCVPRGARVALFGDGRADESSDLLLAVCPTLLAMPLPEDFRLQTCARLLIAAQLSHCTD
jgi:hypothetical protein